LSWVWLAAAFPLLLIANGRWVVALAAWLAPIVLLRFVRGRGAASGIALGALASMAAAIIAWRGMIPVPGALYFALAALFGLIYFLPFAIDRLLAPRLPGFLATFALPLAWSVTDWLSTRFSPYGSWGSVAYTQVDCLPLLQMLSVTGLPGVVFLIGWTAAVMNWAWERGFEWQRVRVGAVACAATLAVVMLLGGLRLALAPPRAETVRVAGITVAWGEAVKVMGLLRPDYSPADLAEALAGTRALQDTLLARSEREARAGAKIVVWSEANGFTVKQDEAGLIERGRALAQRERIWLFMTIASATPEKPAYENQLVAVRPDGSLAFRYHKAHPVPGDRETGADPRIPVPAGSDFGRLAGAICFDMDFPALIRTAGREAADILLAPSSDWLAIDPLHTRMALCRGIENGCSVVRPTHQGLSAAADHQGRVLAAVDFFRARDDVLVAEVPTRGVRTIYARVGDLFSRLATASFLALAARAILGRR
jgi:apolipoprotein N-acyltransferase